MTPEISREVNTGRMICRAADELSDSFFSSKSKDEQHEMLALSISQVRMMRAVWRMTQVHPDGIMLRELADKLSLSSSAVSVMVESMVRRGVLERVQSETDRRKVMIRLSGAGWSKVHEYDRFLQESICGFFATIDAGDAQKFTLIMKQFVEYLQQDKTGEKCK